MQIEIEQRQNHEPIDNIFKLVNSLGYSGYYLDMNNLTLKPINEFMLDVDQNMSNFKTLKYINNFFFFPLENEQETVKIITDKLKCEKTFSN